MSNQNNEFPKSLSEEIMINLLPFVAEPISKRFPNFPYYLAFVLYTVLTLISFAYFAYSLSLAIFLLLVVICITSWSYVFNHLVASIRAESFPLVHPTGIKIYYQYYKVIVSSHSLVLAVIICFLGLAYFFASGLVNNTLELFNLTWESNFGQQAFFFFFIFILVFDISFRIITSINGIFALLYRNYFLQKLHNPKGGSKENMLTYLNTATRHDKGFFLIFVLFLLLIPIPLILDETLLISLITVVYCAVIVFFLIHVFWVKLIRVNISTH